ncbi:MAG: glycine--tRNA ligase subunit beta [Rhodospirillales bacterium]
MAELLFELLSEEIPARMQARAADDLKRLVCEGLTAAQLSYTGAVAHVTPRRLVLVVDGLAEKQPDVRVERKGPRVGSPQAAIDGFLRSAGLASLDQAEVRQVGKHDFYFASLDQTGRPTIELLRDILTGAIKALPWPKSMRWAETAFTWVRPLQNILAVFAGQKVKLWIDDVPRPDHGLHANANTRGHRFLAPRRLEVRDFADYKAQLTTAKVIIDRAERRALIVEGAERLAAAEGLAVRSDEGLLDEVVGLVEWPVPMIGRIDAEFMDVPDEVLITAMRSHQKYFSLVGGDGRLAPRFVVVANTEGRDGGREIVAGNERVLRARLADAKFFWDQDRKRTLADRVEKLSERVFHARLGSDRERVERIAGLARTIAPDAAADADLAERAARLCKADLTTEMVGEFPELQGVMGRYYALNDGEPPEVAEAIADHYSPLGPSDRCPAAPVSVAVALADKIDTLVGFFGIDERPTGSKDPFALRRAALGAIRLIVENRLRMPLLTVFETAREGYVLQKPTGERPTFGDPGRLGTDLLEFFADRLKAHLRGEGVRHDLITAVFARGGEDDLVRLLARVDALKDFLDTDDGANLLTAYRRASNIVRIEEKRDTTSYDGEADEGLLAQAEEAELFRALDRARGEVAEALAGELFADAMASLAKLRPSVDSFFDNVTVNCDDARLRANRLRLLSQIRSALGGVAEFSHIEG